MTEHPILFSTQMIRAIQNTQGWPAAPINQALPFKSQTRRIIKSSKDPKRHWREGDHLWVRETWATRPAWDDIKPSALRDDTTLYFRSDEEHVFVNWRPSIFMPRWASRFDLVIKSMDVQKLQDITDDDCKAEGVIPQFQADLMGSHKLAFKEGWEKINGAGSWKSNPHVRVIEFMVLPSMARFL